MPHSNTVTYRDGRDNDRSAACHGNSHLDCFSDLVKIHMSGYDFIVGADHTDQRSVKLFLRHPQGVK